MNKPRALPKFFRVRQHFASQPIDDIELAVNESLGRSALSGQVRQGQSVAVAVGSRGIADLSRIGGAVVRYLSSIGGVPFIVPAMGSHGGATAEGQAAVLATYGIDEASMGCPIRSSMETVLAGTTDDGVNVYCDKICSEADHVLIVNRIKPHTRLVGTIESGIVKMLMIGLGKHRGAETYHQAFGRYDHRLDRLAEQVIPILLQRIPITLGLAIIEDAYDQVSMIECVAPDELLTREGELLEIARDRMPRLPFDRADLLIVDRMGKEISGTGMDTNVVGRKLNDRSAAVDEYPKVSQIFVRSLTEKTAGNASGIGIAEYCRSQVVRDMDMEVTRVNCLTANHVSACAIPMHMETDREILEAAVTQFGGSSPEELKWIWIQDTLHLGEVACSQGYSQEVQRRDDLSALGSPQDLVFDPLGNLKPME